MIIVHRVVLLLAAAAVGMFGGAGGCRTPEVGREWARYEYTQPQMGVPLRIVLYAESQLKADAAAAAAVARVSELNAALSDYEDASEITRLSQSAGSGRAVPVSADLWAVLAAAQKLSARTDGAFDVTVRPLVQVWRRARRQREMPGLEKLEAAREVTGFRNLELDSRRRTARLQVAGMQLDVGGIAKGYAVDEALKVLRGAGVTRALVALSGDMVAGDAPPGKAGWRIEVPSLDVPDAPAAEFVLLANGALSTSGDLFQRMEASGKRYSHIIDPRTGRPITDHSLVTVLARDCTTADSLATAVSVLGPEAGLRLIRSTPGAEARIHSQPGEKLQRAESPGFRRFVEK